MRRQSRQSVCSLFTTASFFKAQKLCTSRKSFAVLQLLGRYSIQLDLWWPHRNLARSLPNWPTRPWPFSIKCYSPKAVAMKKEPAHPCVQEKSTLGSKCTTTHPCRTLPLGGHRAPSNTLFRLLITPQHPTQRLRLPKPAAILRLHQ